MYRAHSVFIVLFIIRLPIILIVIDVTISIIVCGSIIRRDSSKHVILVIVTHWRWWI